MISNILSEKKIALLLFSFFLSINLLNAQTCACGPTVPTITVNLSANPDTTWTYTGTRIGLCCGQTGSTDCIRFIVTVNAQSSQVGFSANVTGASFYQVDCGPLTPIGTPMCLSGITTFCITFCKPGNNSNDYVISASRGYSASSDVYIRENCSAAISVTGLNTPSITWNSVYPTPNGAYNSFLSCTSACDAPLVTPTAGAPSYIDYQVCGTRAGCATGTYCDTVRVNTAPGMSVGILPINPVICSSGPGTININAVPTGGSSPYSYSWSTGETTNLINVGVGTYTVSVTDNTACPLVTQSVTVTSQTTPVAPTVLDQTICEGTSASLSATAPGGPYEWYNAASGGTLLFTGDTYTTPLLLSNTTYYVQSNPAGCPGPRTAVTVTVTPTPAAPTASGITICQGTTATLTATAPGGTYDWYNAASGGTLLFTGASYTTPVLNVNTTYYVQSTVSGCAGPRTAVLVTVTPLPVAPTASGSTICQGTTATITATAPGGTYQWYDAASGGTLLFTGASYTTPVLNVNTTYYVQTTVSGCAGPRTAVIVTVTPTPAAPTASGTTICQGTTATITATAPGGTYQWYNAASGGTLLFTGASYTTPILNVNTTYFVQTTVSGCIGPRTAVLVTVTPTPVAPTASGITICQGTTATLTATAPGGTYDWYNAASGGTLLYTGASYTTPVLNVNTTYYVQTTVSGCVGPRTAVLVTVTPTPASPTAAGTTICQGSTATLTATAPGGTYEWYNAASGGTLLFTGTSYTTPALAANTTYYVQTTVSGCTGPRTAVLVTVTPTPAAPTASGTTICQGTTATLTATAPGGTYDWYNAASGGSLLFTGASYTTPVLNVNTTYYVQSTVSGCAGPRTAVLVTVTPTPAAPTAAGTTICQGTTATLTATAPGGTYQWYDAASGGTLLFTGASYTTPVLNVNTTYYVQTTVSGCAGPRTAVIVTVTPTPAAPTASGTTICQGTTATITATAPGGTYQWYNAASGGTLLFTGASYTTPILNVNTTYFVQTTVSGCIGPRTAVLVTVTPTPVAPTASGITICQGTTATLTATAPGGTYDWYNAASGGTLLYTGASYTTPVLNVNTTYYVQTTVSGCVGPRTAVLVTVTPLPVAPTASGTGICTGTTATITATAPGGTYDWYDAASGGTLLFTGASYTTPALAATTTYYVQTTVSGCSGPRTAVTVTVNPPPAAPTAAGTSICTGSTATVTATAPGGVYEWYNAASGGTLLYTGASYTTPVLAATTTYYVQSNVSGCIGPRTAVTVTVNPIPAAPTASNTSICINTSATLTATAPGGTYEWYTAASGGTLLFTGASYTTPILAATTTYYVQTIVAGCTSTRTAVTATVSPVPASPTALGTGICTGTSTTLTATAPGGTYQWYDAASGGTLLFTGASYTTPVLNTPTTYYVQTTIGGCSGPRTAVLVDVNPPPVAPTASGTAICQNNTATITATAPGGVYEWYNAASGGTLLFSGASYSTPVLVATTTYYVQSNVSGCIGPRTAVTVTVNPIPAIPTATGLSICTGNTATITATAPGGTYEWYTASSGGTLLQTGASYTTPVLVTTTTYYVQTTISGCTSSRKAVTVTVNPFPNAPSSSSTTICEGNTATISATAPGGTYAWYDASSGGTLLFTGASYTTPILTSTTDYYVQTTVLGCTSSRTQVTVTVTPTPASPTVNGATICQGTSTTLTATAPGGTYEWYTAAIGGTLLQSGSNYTTPILNSNTTYYVQTTISSCSGPRTAVLVTINPTPAAPTANGTTICEGNSTTLSATAPGGTYDWYDAAISGNLLYTGANFTTPNLISTVSYYVQTTINGCIGPFTTVTINVTPTDDPSFSYPFGTYCITGINPIPNISGGFPGSFSSSPAGLVFASTTTGEVNLGASALNTYTITFNTTGPCPSSYAANLTITVAPDATFSYNNPYCIEGTNPLPSFIAGSSAGIFTSSPAGLIFVSSSTGEVDLSNTLSGTYNITNTIPAGGGCALTVANNTLTINPSATVDAGVNQTICEGTQASLNGIIGGSALSATWAASSGSFGNASLLNTTYSPQAGVTSIWLHLTTDDPTGPCTSSMDSVRITVTPLPSAPIANGATICSGTSTTLTATAPGGTYEWYDIPSGGTLLYSGASYSTPNLVSTTTYYVQTTINGCAGPRTAVIVDVTPIPVAPTASDVAICDGDFTTLTATDPGGSYEWYDASTGGSLLASNANFTTPPLSATTSYFVQTTVSGCTGPREEVIVTVNPIPLAPTAANINVCFGNSGTITATAPGGSYGWYDDPSAGTLLYTGNSYTTPVLFANTSYYVQSTILGCTGPRTQVNVTVNPIPDAPTALGTTICSGQTATLTASAPGGVYNWYNVPTGGSSLFTGANFITPMLINTTTYYVQATVLGCSSTSRTAVTVTVTPLPSAPTAAGTQICAGENTILTATNPGGLYEWFDSASGGNLIQSGATYTTPNLITTTSYYVQTTVSGCTGPRTQVTVTVNPIPVLPSVNNLSICDGSSGTLIATAPGGIYEWYDAASGGNLLATGGSYTTPPLSSTTTYYVQTTVSGCTSGRKAVTVTVNPIPVAPTASDETICQGEQAIIVATAPGGTYKWYNAATGGTLLFTGATFTTPSLMVTTTYYVQTTVLGCSSSRIPVTVTVNPIPAAPTVAGTNICEGFTTTLTATEPGGSYQWFDTSIGGTNIGSGNTYTTSVLTNDTSFYVETSILGCTSPRTEVIVIVTPTDDPSFDYTSGTFCISGSNPIPVVTGGFPGTFTSSPAGLSFVNTSTGEVDLSATLLNTYTITYTTTGPCPTTLDKIITITDAPLATFTYNTPLCQTGNNELPSYGVGSSAGIYSSTPAGLSFVDVTSGEIDMTNSLPGNYTLTNFIAASGGCAQASATFDIVINQPATVSAGSNIQSCSGFNVPLSGIIGGTTTSAIWSGGAGTFNDNTSLNAIYTPGAGEISAVLTLTTDDPSGPCSSASSSITITFNPIPAAPTVSGTTICENDSTTLTVSAPGGVYQWYDAAIGGNLLFSGTSFTTPILSSTTDYYVQSTISGCTGPRSQVTVIVNPSPVADAGINDTLCGNNAIMTLSGSIGGSASQGLWTTNGTGFFVPDASTLNASYIPSSNDTLLGVVILTLTTTDQPLECSSVSDSINITYTDAPLVLAGNDKFVCIGSNANISGNVISVSGTGTWTTTGDGSFTNANNLATVYQPGAIDVSVGNVFLILTSTNNASCNAVSDTLQVHLVVPPNVDAGADQTTCSNVPAILNGSVSGTSTTGYWSASGTGSFNPDSTNFGASYIPSQDDITNGSVTITLSSTNSCLVQDQLDISFIQAPVVDAGSNQVVCADVTQISLNGNVAGITTTGIWSTTGTGTFNPDNTTLNATYQISQQDSIAGTVYLILTSTNNGICNAEDDTVRLTITTVPSVNAGGNQIMCANNVLPLSGTVTGGLGTGQWTSSGTGTFLPSDTSLNATYSPSPADTSSGSIIITLTTTGSCVNVSDIINVTITPGPWVDAGSDISVCANNSNINLSGSVSGATVTGLWTTNGSGTFIPSNTDLGATYQPSPADTVSGSITIYLEATNYGNCLPEIDSLNIIFTPSPIINAGNNISICNGSNASLSGFISTSSGYWTTSGTGTFTPSDTILNPVYHPSPADTIAGTVVLTLWSNNNGGCLQVSDNLTLTMVTFPVVNAGTDQVACSNIPVILNGSVTGGTGNGYWTTSGSGTFSPDSSDLNANYLISSDDITTGFVNLILTSTGGCSSNDTMRIDILPGPNSNAGTDLSICNTQTQVNLSGTISGSTNTGIWSTTGTGTFTPNDSTLNATYNISSSDSTAGSVFLILTSTNNGSCPPSIDTLILNINSSPTANAGTDIVTCANNVAVLSGSVISGSSYWTSSGTGTFSPDSSDLNATYNFSNSDTTAGNITIFLNVVNSCGINQDSLSVIITPAPYVDAGENITACTFGDELSLYGHVSAGATTGQWSTNGTGSFVPAIDDLFASYIPSIDDTTNGSVTITLTSTNNGDCNPVSDSLIISFIPTPLVNAGESFTVCNGNIANLNGIITSLTGTGIWTSTGSGSFSPADTLLTTSYIASEQDINLGFVDLILTSTNLGSCSVIDSVHVLFLSGSASLEAGPDQTVCFGDSIFISPTILGDTGTFLWTTLGNNIFLPNDTAWNVTYRPDSVDLDSGSFYIYVKYQFTCGTRFDSLLLTVNPNPTATFTSTSNCTNTSITFTSTSDIITGSIDQWEWDFGDGFNGNASSVSHLYSNDGTYDVSLIVHSNNNCSDTAQSTVQVFPVLNADFDVSDSLIIQGNQVQFTDVSLNPVTWLWTFGDGTGTSDLQNPQYLYNGIGTYTVWLYVTGINNCVDSASQTITVNNNGYAIPTAFSPNGDGLNDYFYVRGGPFIEYELRIFNDWGQQIFVSNNQTAKWDGTFKGKEQPEGTYIYIFNGKIADGTEINISSDISLIR